MNNRRIYTAGVVLLSVLLVSSVAINILQYRTLEAQKPLLKTAQSLYNSSYQGLYRCINTIGTFLTELEEEETLDLSAVSSLFMETTLIEVYTQNLVVFQEYYRGQEQVFAASFYSAMLRFASAVNVVADKWEHNQAPVTAADKELLREIRVAIEQLLIKWSAAKKTVGVSAAGADEVVTAQEEQNLRQAVEKVAGLLEQLAPLD